jgi:hypothetical protein
MSTLQEIEATITKLSTTELVQFREWFEKYDAEMWDNQFERDVQSGKLDKFAKNPIKEFH